MVEKRPKIGPEIVKKLLKIESQFMKHMKMFKGWLKEAPRRHPTGLRAPIPGVPGGSRSSDTI